MPFTTTPFSPPSSPPDPVAPPPPPPPSGPSLPDAPRGRADRSGAIWVTAAGALLLLAAATTFVAVRWDHLHDWQKFGALLVVTQVVLVGGWVGRRRVPATAAATFSLGAVLVPLDAWTIAAAGTGDWHRGLFVGGAVALCAVPIARRLFDTSALRAAWVVALPVAVAGAAAWLHLPVPAVLLAAIGLVAASSGRDGEGRCWLTLGALLPVVTLAEPILPVGRGVLADLGLTGPLVPWATAATAALVVADLALNAGRRGRSDLVTAGVVLAIADVAAALTGGHASAASWWVTAGLMILGVEVAALVTAGDAFWARRSALLAQWAEGASVVVGLGLAATAIASGASARWGCALAAVLLALAWGTADHRQGRARGRTRGVDVLTGAASTGHSLAVATFSTVALMAPPVPFLVRGGLMVAAGAAFLLTHRAGRHLVGPAMLTVGTLLPIGAGPAALPIVVVALGVMAWAARTEPDRNTSISVSTAATLTLAADALGYAVFSDHSPVGLVGLVVAALALGSASAPRARAWSAASPWFLALTTVGVAAAPGLFRLGTSSSTLPAADAVAIAVPTIAVVWLLVEAAWRRHQMPAIAAAVAGPALSLAILSRFDLRTTQTGLGLAVVAVAVVGLTLAAGTRTRVAALVTTALHLFVGAAVTSTDPTALGLVVTITGGLLLAVALVEAMPVLAYNGAAVALLGTWQTLSGAGVTTIEAYAAPLAAVLLAAGMHARATRPVSSWLAYSPPIVLLGGTALAMRLGGAAGWHGLVAGAVAVAAVSVGASRRLAAPLFLGSGLLLAVTVNETLHRTAGVPTWIWLAAGGCILLSSGVVMELRGLGPVESGRRVVRLVAERFE